MAPVSATANKKGEISAEGVVQFPYLGDGTGAAIPVFVDNAAGQTVLPGTLVIT